MITVLVVGDRERARDIDRAAAGNPSLELLHAADVEDALDRLARNRRIDAVLMVLDADEAARGARVLAEEDPAGPPIFGRDLADAPEELLRAIVGRLSS